MIDLSHIHPMLVHFPIVLFLSGAGLELLVLARGGDLAAHRCLANTALAAIVLAAVAAIVTAIFGDIALDHAHALGFSSALLERHPEFGQLTTAYFIVYAALYLFAWWRGYTLVGTRGWAWFILCLVGVLLIVITAYFGGELVYEIGVNVAPVHP